MGASCQEWFSVFFLLYRCVLGFAVLNASWLQAYFRPHLAAVKLFENVAGHSEHTVKVYCCATFLEKPLKWP